MKDHFNSYSLVGGLIPAGLICPWVQQCLMARKACPPVMTASPSIFRLVAEQPGCGHALAIQQTLK